jgi:hypothetical protein
MEASMAAEAGGGEGQAESAEVQAPQVDLSPVLQQIEQVGGRLGQVEALMNQFAPQEEAEEPDAALEALQEFYGNQMPGGELDAETASRLVDGLVEQRMSSAMEQQLSPLIQQIEQLRSQSDAQTLLKAFPEMADPKVAEAVVGGAQQAAVQMGVDPSLARRPGFIELVYKAQKFDQRAAGEVPVGDLNNPALEPGGGASPRGGLQDSANLAQEIVAARGGNSFWGA